MAKGDINYNRPKRPLTEKEGKKHIRQYHGEPNHSQGANEGKYYVPGDMFDVKFTPKNKGKISGKRS